MTLGNFSLSLAVKDLAVSQEFYEKLGFKLLAFIILPTTPLPRGVTQQPRPTPRRLRRCLRSI